jgi:hypothetical protein
VEQIISVTSPTRERETDYAVSSPEAKPSAISIRDSSDNYAVGSPEAKPNA